MISFCDTATDGQRQEILAHGTEEFPIACYFDDLTRTTIPWHWHEEMEVGIVREGNVIIQTPGAQCQLAQGECFFINSSILHTIRRQGLRACSVDSLVFRGNLVGGCGESIFWRKYIQPIILDSGITVFPFRSKIQNEAAAVIQSAWLECAKGDEGYEIDVRYFLSRLFVMMNREQPDISSQARKAITYHNERLKMMLTYIKEHFAEQITVQKIAASAAVSESECNRCFRNILGTSPIAYLKYYRLRCAAALLGSTGEKISSIGQRCGFNEMSYFSKAFKERYHCTPSKYRDRE